MIGRWLMYISVVFVLLLVLQGPRQTTAQVSGVICTVFVDCTGSGAKVSAADWNNMKAYTESRFAVRFRDRVSANCPGETGGVQNEVCYQTTDKSIHVCETATCDGAGWVAYGGTGGATPTLDQVVAAGRVVTSAVSEATAVEIGDGTDALKIWAETGVVNLKGPAGAPLVGKMNINEFTTTPLTLTAQNCTNFDHINNSATAKTVNLCAPTGGESLCISDDFGGVLTVDPGPGVSIVLNGTFIGADTPITSTGNRGDFCCMDAKNTFVWLTKGCQGFS